MKKAITLTVNGATQHHEVEPRMLLVYYLRDVLGLTGTHVGCETSICGACTVLIGDRATRSCIVPVGAVGSQAVTTLEGLGTPDALHPVQAAFIAEAAAQCGHCLNGMIMTVTAMLYRNPRPSDADIRSTLRHNLCRCGTHVEILRAAHSAAAAMSTPLGAAF